MVTAGAESEPVLVFNPFPAWRFPPDRKNALERLYQAPQISGQESTQKVRTVFPMQGTVITRNMFDISTQKSGQFRGAFWQSCFLPPCDQKKDVPQLAHPIAGVD